MSNTPETDDALHLAGMRVDNQVAELDKTCRRMERERNDARTLAYGLRDLVDWKGTPPWNFSWEKSPDPTAMPESCPECGAPKKDGWVGGRRGWECDSYNEAHDNAPLNFKQSIQCAVSHWEESALRAEELLKRAMHWVHTAPIENEKQKRMIEEAEGVLGHE